MLFLLRLVDPILFSLGKFYSQFRLGWRIGGLSLVWTVLWKTFVFFWLIRWAYYRYHERFPLLSQTYKNGDVWEPYFKYTANNEKSLSR